MMVIACLMVEMVGGVLDVILLISTIIILVLLLSIFFSHICVYVIRMVLEMAVLRQTTGGGGQVALRSTATSVPLFLPVPRVRSPAGHRMSVSKHITDSSTELIPALLPGPSVAIICSCLNISADLLFTDSAGVLRAAVGSAVHLASLKLLICCCAR